MESLFSSSYHVPLSYSHLTNSQYCLNFVLKEIERLKKRLRKLQSTEKANVENGLNTVKVDGGGLNPVKVDGSSSPRPAKLEKNPLRERN